MATSRGRGGRGAHYSPLPCHLAPTTGPQSTQINKSEPISEPPDPSFLRQIGPTRSHFGPQGAPQGGSSSICQIQTGIFDERTRCTYAMHIFEAPFQHMHIRYVCSKLLNDITYLFSCHFECCMLNLEIKTNH